MNDNTLQKANRYLLKCNRLEEANGMKMKESDFIEFAREVQRSRHLYVDACDWFEVITHVCYWSEFDQDDVITENVAKIYKTQKSAETAAKKLGGSVRKVFGYNHGNYVEEAF